MKSLVYEKPGNICQSGVVYLFIVWTKVFEELSPLL